jgi:hypothetical protein
MLKSLANLVAFAVIAAALGWHPVEATAAQRRGAPSPAAVEPVAAHDVDLEELFWMCDYAASTGMVDAGERAACNAGTDQLKLEKFGGDFEQLLQWWRANKAVRYQAIERADDANARE